MPDDTMAADMRTIAVFHIVSILGAAPAQAANPGLIPEPVSVEMESGVFQLHYALGLYP